MGLPWLYPSWETLAHALSQISQWMGPYYPVPTPIWIFVAFRRED